jgi:hypothetical protein
LKGLPDPVPGRIQPRSAETWLLAIAEVEKEWCPITKRQRRGVFGKNDKGRLGQKPSKLPKPSSLDHFQAACRKWDTKTMLNNRLSKS